MYSKTNSSTLYNFCIAENQQYALKTLMLFGDIDILYDDDGAKEGAIVKTVISNKQSKLLVAILDYFENKQFPDKGSESGYKKAREKLVDILDEYNDGFSFSKEIMLIMSKYTGNDVAILEDLEDCETSSSVTDSDQSYLGESKIVLAGEDSEFISLNSESLALLDQNK